MTVLGLLNSRMKDFFDLWTLSRAFPFDGATLSAAIKATFARRQTPIPGDPPTALAAGFYEDAAKLRQWSAFLQKGLDADRPPLAEVIAALREFLMPPATALSQGQPFDMVWRAGAAGRPPRTRSRCLNDGFALGAAGRAYAVGQRMSYETTYG